MKNNCIKHRFRTMMGEVKDICQILNLVNFHAGSNIGLIVEVKPYENCTEIIIIDHLFEKRKDNLAFSFSLITNYYIDSKPGYYELKLNED